MYLFDWYTQKDTSIYVLICVRVRGTVLGYGFGVRFFRVRFSGYGFGVRFFRVRFSGYGFGVRFVRYLLQSVQFGTAWYTCTLSHTGTVWCTALQSF